MGKLDVAVKHAITLCPGDWAELAGLPPGVPIEIVDSDVSAVANVADKVFRVLADDPFLLHFEPQGYYDVAVDDRNLTYNALLRRRHRMFVHTVLIALTRDAWGPANTGRVRAESPVGGCHVDFSYEVIKVWELPVERIFAGGVGILPLAPIADVAQDDIPGVIDRIAERFDAELPRADAAEFWTATLLLIGLKYDKAFATRILQGVHDIMRESSTYLAILEEGHVQANRKTLIRQGTRRFGEPDAETQAAIQAISDPDRLDAMLLRMLEADSWDDLLATQ